MPLRPERVVVNEVVVCMRKMQFKKGKKDFMQCIKGGGTDKEADDFIEPRMGVFFTALMPQGPLAWLKDNLGRLIVYGGDDLPETLCTIVARMGDAGVLVAEAALHTLPRARRKRGGWTDKQFRALFGFERAHLTMLADYLLADLCRGSEVVQVGHSCGASREIALRVAILRLRGNQWKFVASTLGMHESDACSIGGAVLAELGKLGMRALDLAQNRGWVEGRVVRYTRAHGIFATNFDGARVWGTVDGTTMQTARIHKGALAKRVGHDEWFRKHIGFSGHHRRSELTWLSVTTPDGMTAHMTGIYLGGTTDYSIQMKPDDPRSVERLQVWVPADERDDARPAHVMRDGQPAGRTYVRAQLYGDSGFNKTNAVLVSESHTYRGWLDIMEKAHRVPSEWDNKDVKFFHALEEYAGFTRVLNLSSNFASDVVFGAYLLKNARTCLYGNETSEFFGIAPPTLQEYFSCFVNLFGPVPAF